MIRWRIILRLVTAYTGAYTGAYAVGIIEVPPLMFEIREYKKARA